MPGGVISIRNYARQFPRLAIDEASLMEFLSLRRGKSLGRLAAVNGKQEQSSRF
jgi:hypothetical protein